MNRRTILKQIGAGGLLALGVNQAVAARSGTVERLDDSAAATFGGERSDVTTQDECVIQCGDPCPRYCDKCLCWG